MSTLNKIMTRGERVSKLAMVTCKFVKDYGYSLIRSSEPKSRMFSKNVGADVVAQELNNEMRKVFPDLMVHYIGSSALGIMGACDIDLLVEGEESRWREYEERLSQLWDKPVKSNSGAVEWCFDRDKFGVEVELVPKGSWIVWEQLTIFRLLKNNVELRRAYERLKLKNQRASSRKMGMAKSVFVFRMLSEYLREPERYRIEA